MKGTLSSYSVLPFVSVKNESRNQRKLFRLLPRVYVPVHVPACIVLVKNVSYVNSTSIGIYGKCIEYSSVCARGASILFYFVPSGQRVYHFNKEKE